jgi:hypothetical protein
VTINQKKEKNTSTEETMSQPLLDYLGRLMRNMGKNLPSIFRSVIVEPHVEIKKRAQKKAHLSR